MGGRGKRSPYRNHKLQGEAPQLDFFARLTASADMKIPGSDAGGPWAH